MTDSPLPPDDQQPNNNPSPFEDFINRHLNVNDITDGSDYEFVLGDPDGHFQFSDRLWVRRKDQTDFVLYWRADLLRSDDDEDEDNESEDAKMTTDDEDSSEAIESEDSSATRSKKLRPLWRTLLDLLLLIGLFVGFVLFFELFGDELPYARAERQRQAEIRATLDTQAQHYQAMIEALIATIEAPQPHE